jgi:hypothetical protein
MADVGAGRQMKYPYTFLGKMAQFPWKHHWKYGRGFRFVYIAVGLTLPLIYPIHKFGEYSFTSCSELKLLSSPMAWLHIVMLQLIESKSRFSATAC